MFNWFSRNGERRAKKKAWASDIKRKARIVKAQRAELAERKRGAKEAKEEARRQRQLKSLKSQSEVYRAEAGVYEAKARRKKAKRAASPFSIGGGIGLPKKKKQSGKLKKHTKIGL